MVCERVETCRFARASCSWVALAMMSSWDRLQRFSWFFSFGAASFFFRCRRVWVSIGDNGGIFLVYRVFFEEFCVLRGLGIQIGLYLSLFSSIEIFNLLATLMYGIVFFLFCLQNQLFPSLFYLLLDRMGHWSARIVCIDPLHRAGIVCVNHDYIVIPYIFLFTTPTHGNGIFATLAHFFTPLTSSPLYFLTTYFLTTTSSTSIPFNASSASKPYLLPTT